MQHCTVASVALVAAARRSGRGCEVAGGLSVHVFAVLQNRAAPASHRSMRELLCGRQRKCGEAERSHLLVGAPIISDMSFHKHSCSSLLSYIQFPALVTRYVA